MNTRTGLVLLGSHLAVVALLLVGCGKPAETNTAAPMVTVSGAEVSDVDISTNVKTALHRDPILQRFDIAVSTIKGDVRLVGVVDSQAQIDEAIKIARAAAGTHTVHNELTIK